MDKINWIDFQTLTDDRGCLTAIEQNQDIPIEIKRIFYMHGVKEDRGGHAHRDTDQVILAISGSFDVTLKNTRQTLNFSFDDPKKGLYVPRMIFTELYNFSEDAVCLVLANTHYDITQSIRTWDDYLKVKAGMI